MQGWGASIFEDIIPQLNQYLKANSVIGGIVGHNAGEVDFSYIAHETEIQTEIDAELVKTLGSISAKAVVNYFRNLVIDEEYNSTDP